MLQNNHLPNYTKLSVVPVKIFSQWFFVNSKVIMTTSTMSKFGDNIECADLCDKCEVMCNTPRSHKNAIVEVCLLKM